MGFQANFPKLSDTINSEFGESATYTLVGGSPIELLAVLTRGEELDDARWQNALQATATVLVLKSDVAAWSRGDTVEIGGETWVVERLLSDTPGDWELEVRHDLRPTFKR